MIIPFLWLEPLPQVPVVAVPVDLADPEMERSRSGNGSHAWFFFEKATPALEARRFGTALLTKTMENRHELSFNSYDRLFPNQDTMPAGGFGNLIGLPLQKAARNNGNSVFVDTSFQPYEDQWVILSQVQRLREDTVNGILFH